MFDAIHSMHIDWILDGIIISIVFGFAAGNYACSLVHRLPRGRLILDKTPYCGSCGTGLQVKDLFPVISALLLKHKCRYCHTPFPVSHTWTEILVGFLFVLTFFKYGFGEQYILVVLIGIFLITQAAIEANEKMVMRSVMICVLVCGVVFRTLQDHSIFPFFHGALLALVIGCFIWRKQTKRVGHIYVPSDLVLMIAVAGACVGVDALPVLAGLSKRPPLSSVSVGVATILLVLYPQIGILHLP